MKKHLELKKDDEFCGNCGMDISITEIEDVPAKTELRCLNCKKEIEVYQDICPHCGVDLDQFSRDLLNTCVECGYSDPSLENISECPKCGAILPI